MKNTYALNISIWSRPAIYNFIKFMRASRSDLVVENLLFATSLKTESYETYLARIFSEYFRDSDRLGSSKLN